MKIILEAKYVIMSIIPNIFTSLNNNSETMKFELQLIQKLKYLETKKITL